METGLEGREAHVDAGRSVRVLQVVCRIAGLRPCQAGTCIRGVSVCVRVRVCVCLFARLDTTGNALCTLTSWLH